MAFCSSSQPEDEDMGGAKIVFHEQFMGAEWLWQILWGQKWLSTAYRDRGVPGEIHGDKGGLGTVHRHRGVPGITHENRDSPGITQDVALTNLTRIEGSWRNSWGHQYCSQGQSGLGRHSGDRAPA